MRASKAMVRWVKAVEENNRMLKIIMTELGLEVPEPGDTRLPHRVRAEEKTKADEHRKEKAADEAAKKQKADAKKKKQAEKEQAARNKKLTGKAAKPKGGKGKKSKGKK